MTDTRAGISAERVTWSCETAQAQIGRIVHEHGRPITRRTLDAWIRKGLPSHQPGGPRSKRFFYSDEVVSWLNSRNGAVEVAS